MQSVAKTTFKSPINVDYVYAVTPLSEETTSTLELWIDPTDNTWSQIEWDVPELEITEHIGIYHDENKVINDYDGVFEVPPQAIQFLKDNGYNVDYLLD